MLTDTELYLTQKSIYRYIFKVKKHLLNVYMCLLNNSYIYQQNYKCDQKVYTIYKYKQRMTFVSYQLKLHY